MSLAIRLKVARLAAGLTQEELAKACGYSRTAITNMENDKHDPTVKGLIAIAQALGVTADSLLRDIPADQPARDVLALRYAAERAVRQLEWRAHSLRRSAADTEDAADKLREALKAYPTSTEV